MTELEKTYVMAKNPPPPMTWEDYERRLKEEWGKLLEKEYLYSASTGQLEDAGRSCWMR
jgi:hypothetical protein